MPYITIETIRKQLHSRALELRTELGHIEKALVALSDTPLTHREPKARPQRKTKAAPQKKKKTRTYSPERVTNPGRRIRDYLTDVLGNTPGLTPAELTDRLLAKGWQTTSKNPISVLYQELSGDRGKAFYTRDNEGRWRLRPDLAQSA